MSYLQKYVLKKTKDINVKVFNMITNKNEAKAMTKHISCDFKCKFNSTTCNSYQKWNKKTFQLFKLFIVSAKKIIVGILAHLIVKIVSI